MSEKVICDKADLVAIADATRAATGGTSTFSVSELSVATVQAINEGGGSKDAVLYTEQELTEEQKEQARKNIKAIGQDELVEGSTTDTFIWDGNVALCETFKPDEGGTMTFIKIGVVTDKLAELITEINAASDTEGIICTMSDKSQYGYAGGAEDGLIISYGVGYIYILGPTTYAQLVMPTPGIWWVTESYSPYPTSITIPNAEFDSIKLKEQLLPTTVTNFMRDPRYVVYKIENIDSVNRLCYENTTTPITVSELSDAFYSGKVIYTNNGGGYFIVLRLNIYESYGIVAFGELYTGGKIEWAYAYTAEYEP